MTGFGKSETQFDNKKIVVELRTLNSKNIDLNIRTPHSYREIESLIRKEVNNHLTRGKIDISIFVDNSGLESSSKLNQEVIKGYMNQLRSIEPIDDLELLKIAVRLPDTLKSEKEDLDEQEKKAVVSLVVETIQKVNQHRASEGAVLEKDFISRLEELRHLLEEVIKIDPERTEKVREKLVAAVDHLKAEVDQNRFEQELIYYLEKYDITEEKVRLKNHIDYFFEIMNQQIPNGKKLGFIAQEMGREINTIGSKANHAGLQKIVVQMKDELEKIKEQLLNVL
jgi:uncharacterized protein (TIGR00255 family)